jgi:hypothetical protein
MGFTDQQIGFGLVIDAFPSPLASNQAPYRLDLCQV